MQLAHRDQHRPAGQLVRRLVEVGDRLEARVLEQVEELVLAGGVAGAADRPGRLDDQRGVAGATVQHQSAGDAEDRGLAGCARPVGRVRRRGGGGNGRSGEGLGGEGRLQPGGVGGHVALGLADAADGAGQLLLGDRDDLGGDAAGMGEGEHGCLVADEEHGAGRLQKGVAGGAAGGAFVVVGCVGAAEQAVGLVVADLGSDLVADVEHARHWVSSVRGRKYRLGAVGTGARGLGAGPRGRTGWSRRVGSVRAGRRRRPGRPYQRALVAGVTGGGQG